MSSRSYATNACKTCSGLTLIELLVALGIMAIMAVMSWQGLDAMARTRTMAEDHQNQVAVLNTGLQQWMQDLDKVVETPPLSVLTWDGRVLRLIRRSTGGASDGLLVAAWTRNVRGVNGVGQGQWLRWQSKPQATVNELRAAYDQAGLWAQNAGDAERQQETSIVPLDGWQIYFYRGGAWTNPLSAESQPGESSVTSYTTDSVTGGAAIDGIRLVLTLSPGHPMGGTLTRDWVRPTLSDGKS
jgi:general secretion pathway protein J